MRRTGSESTLSILPKSRCGFKSLLVQEGSSPDVDWAGSGHVELMVRRSRFILHAILHAVVKSLRGGSLIQAQAVAFNMFVAFFPALLFLAGVMGYVEPGLEELTEGMRVVLPPGSRRVVVNFLVKLAEHPERLLVVGAVGTVLLGSQLMFSLSRIFCSMYDREERRGFWRRQLLAVAMVFVTIVPWVAVSVLVVFSKFVRAWLIEELDGGFDRVVRLFWSAGYFALALVTATMVLAALYYFLGPHRSRRWDDVLPGAALAMVFWLIVTTGFAFYVSTLGIYNVIYGSFAAAIGLLIWMYLSAVVILIGSQFNAELARLRTPREI